MRTHLSWSTLTGRVVGSVWLMRKWHASAQGPHVMLQSLSIANWVMLVDLTCRQPMMRIWSPQDTSHHWHHMPSEYWRFCLHTVYHTTIHRYIWNTLKIIVICCFVKWKKVFIETDMKYAMCHHRWHLEMIENTILVNKTSWVSLNHVLHFSLIFSSYLVSVVFWSLMLFTLRVVCYVCVCVILFIISYQIKYCIPSH